MPSIVEHLFPAPDYHRTPRSLLRWWESRRGLYNRAVGSAGLVTVLGVFVLHPAREAFLEPALLLVILAYGLMANVCYSLGWAAELLANAVWGRRAPDMGPLLFREGLIFSVGLTLFPLVLAILFTIARVLFALVT